MKNGEIEIKWMKKGDNLGKRKWKKYKIIKKGLFEMFCIWIDVYLYEVILERVGIDG